MKVAFAAVVLSLACLPALAQYQGPQVIAPVNTAAAANQAIDDTPVVLEGVLARKIKSETYEFNDASGSVTVEIDDELFPSGAPIDATTRLRLTGEVDKGWNKIEIDVKRIDLLP